MNTHGLLTQSNGTNIIANQPNTITSLSANGGNIILDAATNDFNTIQISANQASIRDINTIDLGSSIIADTFNIVANQNITQSAALIMSGAASFTAGSDITLNNSNNDFSSISMSGHDVYVQDKNALTLNASSLTGDLTVLTNGDISQNGALVVPGAASFIANAHAITLNDANNQLSGAVALSNAGNHNVALSNNGSLLLAASSLGSGTLDLTATSISQNGAIIEEANAGITTINANDGAIALTDSNNLFTGTVKLNNRGDNNVALTNDGALTIGTSNIGSGTLALNWRGTLNETGAITQESQAKTITLTANAPQSDLLLSAANDLNSNIIIGSPQYINDFNLHNINQNASLPLNLDSLTNLRDLTLTFDAAGISFPTLRMSGHLNVTAGGNITETGTLTMTGALKVASMNTGSHDITLENNNDFDTINITAHDVNINDINALTLGSSNISGNLIVNTHGHILLTGNLDMFGSQKTAIFNANNNDITLNASINGAIDLALNAGLSNDIFVNADLGDTARLRTITIDPHNFISNATIRVTSFIQNEGTGITLFNHGGLDATEGASLVPNSLNGNIKVTSLTFNIDTGNMFGTVNGLSAEAAIRQLNVLNPIVPEKIYFDGIDICSVLCPRVTPSNVSNNTNTIISNNTLTNGATESTQTNYLSQNNLGERVIVEKAMYPYNVISINNDLYPFDEKKPNSAIIFDTENSLAMQKNKKEYNITQSDGYCIEPFPGLKICRMKTFSFKSNH